MLISFQFRDIKVECVLDEPEQKVAFYQFTLEVIQVSFWNMQVMETVSKVLPRLKGGETGTMSRGKGSILEQHAMPDLEPATIPFLVPLMCLALF